MSDIPTQFETPYVKIAGAIGGSCVAIFGIAAIFAQGELWPAAVAVLGLSVMGIGLAYFISKGR